MNFIQEQPMRKSLRLFLPINKKNEEKKDLSLQILFSCGKIIQL